jgi:NADH-quinone oxidoreductase subunit M
LWPAWSGVVLVTNLFLFYIFWELMLIPSYALIAYWGTGNPRLIGFKYFVFTHAGALALLIGIAWLAALFNNLNIFELGALAAAADTALRPIPHNNSRPNICRGSGEDGCLPVPHMAA